MITIIYLERDERISNDVSNEDIYESFNLMPDLVQRRIFYFEGSSKIEKM